MLSIIYVVYCILYCILYVVCYDVYYIVLCIVYFILCVFMFSLLLEKFDTIKKQRGLYCLQFEKIHANQNNKDIITLYDFICKNRRS